MKIFRLCLIAKILKYDQISKINMIAAKMIDAKLLKKKGTINRPFIVDRELEYIKDATIDQGILRGDGVCTKALERIYQKTWRRNAKQR